MKWQLKIESTEDDCYMLFFFGRVPRKIISTAIKTVVSAVAVLALTQYYPR